MARQLPRESVHIILDTLLEQYPEDVEACEAIRIKLDITPGDSDFAYLPVE